MKLELHLMQLAQKKYRGHVYLVRSLPSLQHAPLQTFLLAFSFDLYKHKRSFSLYSSGKFSLWDGTKVD